MGQRREKPEGRRPLGRSKHKLEDNIAIELKEIGSEGMNWICLTQDIDQQ